MTPPSILDAVRALNARKEAAGVVEPVNGPPLTEVPAFLAGTDLDPAEVHEFTELNGRRAMALALAHGTVSAGGSLWCDGLFTGLELARLRAVEDDVGGRLRAMRRGLQAAKRTLEQRRDELGYAQPAEAVERALTIITLTLEGEAEDA